MMPVFSKVIRLCICIVVAVGMSQPAHAQFGKLKDRAKRAAENAAGKVAGKAVDRAADDAAQKASEAANQAIDDAILGTPDSSAAGSSGGSVRAVNASGTADASAGLGALGAMLTGGGGGSVETVDFRELKALLPEQISGLKRTNAEGQKSTVMGISTSNASATYESGGGDDGGSLDVTITDLGSMRGFAMLGYAWANTEVDQETSSGYERTVKYKDFPGYEQLDRGDGYSTAKFSVVVGQRFLIEADGNNVDMAKVKGAIDQIDVAKLESMKDVGIGEGLEVVDFQKLKALLPNSVAGLSRSNATGQKSNAMGIISSSAKGDYSSGDKNMTVTITDLGSLKGLTVFGYGWINGGMETESDDGYEKTGKYKDFPSHESFQKDGSSAQFDVVVNQRFMVSAQGSGVTMDDVKAAIDAIDLSQLTPPEPAK